MQDEWKSFLTKNGAVFDKNKLTTFGQAERERKIATSGLILTDLSHYGHISLSGTEAKSYLQGQLTCDLEKITPTHSRLGAHCNQKGRVVSLFRVLLHQEQYLLRLPYDNLANAEAFLKKYSLFSKVLIENVSNNWVTIGLCGPNARRHLEEALGQTPVEDNQQITHGDVSVIAIPGLSERFEICGTLDAIIELWEKLDVHAAPVGPDAWSIHDLLIGLPQITEPLSEEFLPQSLDLSHWKAISFDKGCFLGQEVIARLHYKGQVKRVLQAFQGKATHLPKPGDNLLSDDEKPIGTILTAKWLLDGNIGLLAVIKKTTEDKPLHLPDEKRPLTASPFQR